MLIELTITYLYGTVRNKVFNAFIYSMFVFLAAVLLMILECYAVPIGKYLLYIWT